MLLKLYACAVEHWLNEERKKERRRGEGEKRKTKCSEHPKTEISTKSHYLPANTYM